MAMREANTGCYAEAAKNIFKPCSKETPTIPDPITERLTPAQKANPSCSDTELQSSQSSLSYLCSEDHSDNDASSASSVISLLSLET